MPHFITLGMAAKIIVVVENQNAGIGTVLFAEKVSCRQPANTTANNDQIKFLLTSICGSPGLTVAKPMGDFERSFMTAAQTLEGWRVVTGRYSILIYQALGNRIHGRNGTACSEGNCTTIKKITPTY